MKKPGLIIEPGRPHPLGATLDENGVNFSVISVNATSVELLLFDHYNDVQPFATVLFHPVANRTFYFWYAYVRGIKPGVHYAFRVDGPWAPDSGHRFDKDKLLIDPYSKGNNASLWCPLDARCEGDNLEKSMRSIVIDHKKYDWKGDKPLKRSMEDTIIYEMHVRGFTRSESSGTAHPGTFTGMIEKIPYLKELGVTAVELLPIFEFNRNETLRTLEDGTKVTNYWGYSTIGYFSPESDYCINPAGGEQLNEFCDLVRALHAAGIEVILDVVFNHTNEGDHLGPTICFRGFDNSVYYQLDPNGKHRYLDFSGCGNTVNCNHPIVEKFIVDCLSFWVNEMHVDGFRFDEGSILTRGMDGCPLQYPPLIWNIELQEAFSNTKLIAEAWDAAGLYQIGGFPGYRWGEWNGKYRDMVRRFVKGDPGLVGELATRIAGSSDIYQHSNHKPTNSINFIDCHDGFTLMDLVSYNVKHNEANGEENRDGFNENLSWNCGIEGETGNEEILRLRDRQVRNFAVILFLSRGVPMFQMGNETGRTQGGNNNAYCQDNPVSWFDWTLPEKNACLFRFFKLLIEFRKNNSLLKKGDFFTGALNERGLKDIEWHGLRLHSPGWDDPAAKVLAFTMGSFTDGEPDIHVMLNMDESDFEFDNPENRERTWHRFVDTSLPSPQDIMPLKKEPAISGPTYLVKSHSSVILVSR